jgi:transposase
LKAVYPDRWKEILSLAFFTLSFNKPLYLFNEWASHTYLANQKEMSSKKVSKLLKELGDDARSQNNFFFAWGDHAKDTSSVIFDITSISSYSELIDLVDWGYNRDKEKLPQINLGMVFGEPSSLPLFYSLYEGSIPDIVTLKNIVLRLNAFNIKAAFFVLDRGFYSKNNIKLLVENNINFLMPVPFTTSMSSEIITKHMNTINSPIKSFLYRDSVIFVEEEDIEIEGNRFHLFLYLDKKREALEGEKFVKEILEIESELRYHHKKKPFNDLLEIKEFINSTNEGYVKYFDIVIEGTNLIIKKGRD